LYVPSRLIQYYKKKERQNADKFRDLDKSLRKSRMPVTAARYKAISTFYPLALMPIFLIFGFFIGNGISNLLAGSAITYNAPFRLPMLPLETKLLLIKIIAIIFISLLLSLFTRFIILLYPKYYAMQRKQNIELVFPHVVNMMLGMAKGGTPVLDIFRIVAEESSVTGEVGKEFSIIVSNVEIFHKDLIESMRDVAHTTPSDIFSDFLDDLVSIVSGSGRISEFLEFKSKHLVDEREKYQDLFLNSLGIMAEVYVSIFVVAPLFIIIIFVVMSMLGEINEQLISLVVYVYMPVGGIMFMWMLSSMVRGQDFKWTQERLRRSILKARVVDRKESDFKYHKNYQKTLFSLKNKFKMLTSDLGALIYKPELTFYITIPLTTITLPFIIGWEIETLLLFIAVLNVLPYALLAEIRKRKINKIEENIPDFLKQLASLNESGLNVVVAIRMLSSSNLGLLTDEIIKIRKDLEWGMLLSDALKRFEMRIGSITVTQVTSILIRAMDAAGTIKDALYTAARDAHLYISMRKRVNNEMIIYTIIIYMTFGVFLFTIIMLQRNFLSVFTTEMPLQGFSGQSFRAPDLKAISELFYRTSLINGTISGLIAGLMGEGEIKSGLKHAIILACIAFFTFKLFG